MRRSASKPSASSPDRERTFRPRAVRQAARGSQAPAAAGSRAGTHGGQQVYAETTDGSNPCSEVAPDRNNHPGAIDARISGLVIGRSIRYITLVCSPFLVPSSSPERFSGSGGHQACGAGRSLSSSRAPGCRPGPELSFAEIVRPEGSPLADGVLTAPGRPTRGLDRPQEGDPWQEDGGEA